MTTMVLAPQLADSEKFMSKQLKGSYMKYGELTFGQVEAVVNKLGGMEGVRRLLSDELTVSEAPKVWKLWKTIKLKFGVKNPVALRVEMHRAGIKISDGGADIFQKTHFTKGSHGEEFEFVIASIAELGFKQSASTKEVLTRAGELGLAICPAEVGPYFALQNKDYLKGDVFHVAMEPIADSDDDPRIFSIEDIDGEGWLNASDGRAFSFWPVTDQFIFMKKKIALIT